MGHKNIIGPRPIGGARAGLPVQEQTLRTARNRQNKKTNRHSELTTVGCNQAIKPLYKLKRCPKKECCKQCQYVKYKGTMTKWPVQKPTHITTQKHQDATDI